MDTERKVFREIHTRYNFLLATSMQCSYLYVGYLEKKKPTSKVMDLFVQLLTLATFSNPQATADKLYDYLTANATDSHKLNIAYKRFSDELLKKNLPNFITTPEARALLDDLDRLSHKRPPFNWDAFYTRPTPKIQ
jgi:hypothetical protein